MNYFNIMVRGNGFIGDGLFQSSVFKKLREKYPTTETQKTIIHTYHPLLQVREQWKRNPYINFIHDKPQPERFMIHDGRFHLEIDLPHVITQEFPVTIQHQAAAGIEDQEVGYSAYVSKYAHRHIKADADGIRQYAIQERKAFPIIVAAQRNWREKSFLFTKEQYEAAVDVPYLGYGGAHRDTDKIIELLRGKYNLLVAEVGLPNGIVSSDSQAQDSENENGDTFGDVTDFIYNCDYFIGSEGGLSNLAAGLGVKCIITTDFIAQLYGPKGVLKQIEHPAMGPSTYFPEAGHVHLNPFLTDEEVAESIYEIITNDQHAAFVEQHLTPDQS